MDFVNLMTYDFRVAAPGEPAGHHANLYPNPADPTAGLGRRRRPRLPRRGRAGVEARARRAVLRARVGGTGLSGGALPGRAGLPARAIDTTYPSLAALIGREGWVREWDAAAQAPFLWNEARGAFVTYEDEESLRVKSRYVLAKGLGGVMFWEYHADRTGALLDTLDAALRGEDVVPLSGVWRFELDPADEGLVASWENRTLADRIRLPGLLQAQGFGDDVTVDTKWTGQIVDRSWFTAPRYEPYRQPGNVKVPFWLQPDKHYVGAAWYQRDVEVPAGVAGPARRAHARAAALGDARLARRAGRSARTTASRRRTSTTSGTASRPGKHRLTIRVDNRLVVDVGVQLAQRHRPHAGQLERHRGRDRAARDAARCGSTTCRSIPHVASAVGASCAAGSATRRASAVAGRFESASRRLRSGDRPGAGPRVEGARRVVGRVGRRRSSCEMPLGASAPTVGRVHARAPTGSRATLDGGRGSRHAAGPLRPARDRHAGHAVRAQRPQDLPPRHAGVLHLPADRPSADRRGLVEADHPHRQGARAEP